MRRAFVLIGSLTLLLAGCYSGTHPPGIGKPAPNFTVKDADRTVTLSDFRGKVVVLNFWATWCPPCVDETPSLVELQQRLKNKGVVVLGVSWDEDPDAYYKFLKDHNIDFLTVRDPAQNSSRLYGTVKIPETYIIDRKGIVRRKFISDVDWMRPDIIRYLSQL